ncbi:hypothetical protein SLEP1_g18802 [Rubroshorea leprosula]|uniref:Reverse transcriptase domain-containing protein n=1 Tax=Rubroshorea leprosula TaxID=152421 RepID=A0AAV5J4R0_9ROSI|nr:hypothetical protein SLEP1_g18802 [Rubroshorea leprosula]
MLEGYEAGGSHVPLLSFVSYGVSFQVMSSNFNIMISVKGLSSPTIRLKLTHHHFADDLMLLSRGDEHSPLLMKKYFDEFSIVSGLNANLGKSCIFFSDLFGN